MGGYQLRTVRGYDLFEVASAMQKSIRRGDVRSAGYWVTELWESGFRDYAWRRLMIISAEDFAGIITKEVMALYQACQIILKKRGKKAPEGRLFPAKSAMLMAKARKCRDPDHVTCLFYDPENMTNAVVEEQLEAVREEMMEVPDYAFDVHTRKGKAAGKTRRDFFIEEWEALDPREVGEFDTELIQMKLEFA